jgi:hypothetical protein
MVRRAPVADDDGAALGERLHRSRDELEARLDQERLRLDAECTFRPKFYRGAVSRRTPRKGPNKMYEEAMEKVQRRKEMHRERDLRGDADCSFKPALNKSSLFRSARRSPRSPMAAGAGAGAGSGAGNGAGNGGAHSPSSSLYNMDRIKEATARRERERRAREMEGCTFAPKTRPKKGVGSGGRKSTKGEAGGEDAGEGGGGVASGSGGIVGGDGDGVGDGVGDGNSSDSDVGVGVGGAVGVGGNVGGGARGGDNGAAVAAAAADRLYRHARSASMQQRRAGKTKRLDSEINAECTFSPDMGKVARTVKSPAPGKGPAAQPMRQKRSPRKITPGHHGGPPKTNAADLTSPPPPRSAVASVAGLKAAKAAKAAKARLVLLLDKKATQDEGVVAGGGDSTYAHVHARDLQGATLAEPGRLSAVEDAVEAGEEEEEESSENSKTDVGDAMLACVQCAIRCGCSTGASDVDAMRRGGDTATLATLATAEVASTAQNVRLGVAFARQVFFDADTGGDGSLSKTEIRKYFKSHPIEKSHILGPDFTWKAFFTSMDKDGDDAFDIDEFTEAVSHVYHVQRVVESKADEEQLEKALHDIGDDMGGRCAQCHAVHLEKESDREGEGAVTRERRGGVSGVGL